MIFKPTVSIVGSGRMAHALTVALTGREIIPEYVISRNEQEGAKLASSSLFKFLPLEKHLQLDSEIVFLAVSDDAIHEVAGVLKSGGNGLLVHTSGAKGLDVLRVASLNGWRVASIHPIQTIPVNAGKAVFQGATFSILCENGDFKTLSNLCTMLGGNVVRVSTEEKAIIHTTAVFMSNYLVTLADVGEKILKAGNLSEKIPLSVFKPLMTKSLDEIHTKGVNNALTGPVSRGDLGTLMNHISLLEELGLNTIAELYATLGKHTAELAKDAKRIDKETVSQVIKTLSKK